MVPNVLNDQCHVKYNWKIKAPRKQILEPQFLVFSHDDHGSYSLRPCKQWTQGASKATVSD